MTQQLTGSEFKLRYGGDCLFFKLCPVTKVDNSALFDFVYDPGVLPAVMSGKYRHDKIRHAWIPDNATVTFNNTPHHENSVHQTDIIQLGAREDFNEWSDVVSTADWIRWLRSNSKILQYVKDKQLLEELATIAVARDGLALMDVPEQMRTKSICIVAIQQNPAALEYVPVGMQSDLVIKMASRTNCRLNGFDFGAYGEYFVDKLEDNVGPSKICTIDKIGNIPNDIVDDTDYAALVKLNGLDLAKVPEQMMSSELCELAIQNNAFALKHVPVSMITPDLCEAAVNQRANTLQYVPENMRTEEICASAIEQNKDSIRYVPKNKFTKRVILAAIKSYRYIPAYIPEELMTDSIYLDAVKADGKIINHVPDEMITEDLCLAAVKANAIALKYVPDRMKTVAVCIAAIERTGTYDNVPKRMLTDEFMDKTDDYIW